ncbi:hypothetical protein HYW75_03525 [Candidatus Pacearchaeota archaeon]|nr:hypothetical protein [Candidatus Pacearchaeota archaeon]
MDYGYSERRKTKGDKKAKMRFNKYKRGGQFRTANINLENKDGKKGN